MIAAPSKTNYHINQITVEVQGNNSRFVTSQLNSEGRIVLFNHYSADVTVAYKLHILWKDD